MKISERAVEKLVEEVLNDDGFYEPYIENVQARGEIAGWSIFKVEAEGKFFNVFLDIEEDTE